MNKLVNEYFFHSSVSAKDMDLVWSEGWRHFGKYFYRYSRVQETTQEGYKHVLPLRINVNDFVLQNSHKRILKKNKHLNLRILPAFVNHDVNILFEKHKQRFSSNIPENIHVFVSKEPAYIPCECLSLCIYDQNKLIGISYLDIGQTSCSSVYQCYDPSYPKNSLGIYMVLQSLAYAKEHKKSLYYPGYAYHEASHYDYKKKFNALTYYDWKGQWLDYEASKSSS